MKEGGGGGEGEGRKETLADKPLNFENLCSPVNVAPDWLGKLNSENACAVRMHVRSDMVRYGLILSRVSIKRPLT